jgi:hypothetical protein
MPRSTDSETTITACGSQEAATHVLADCPILKELRRELRETTGDEFISVTVLLGGCEEGVRGKFDIASRAKAVEAVLAFAETSEVSKSRATRAA